MIFEEALTAFLVGNVPISALIDGRVYPVMIPQHVQDDQTKIPCAVYDIVGTNPDMTFCGPTGLVEKVVRIHSVALKYLLAKQLATTIRKQLVGYGGLMGDMQISTILMETEEDGIDPNPGLLRVSQLYHVWFNEE